MGDLINDTFPMVIGAGLLVHTTDTMFSKRHSPRRKTVKPPLKKRPATAKKMVKRKPTKTKVKSKTKSKKRR